MVLRNFDREWFKDDQRKSPRKRVIAIYRQRERAYLFSEETFAATRRELMPLVGMATSSAVESIKADSERYLRNLLGFAQERIDEEMEQVDEGARSEVRTRGLQEARVFWERKLRNKKTDSLVARVARERMFCIEEELRPQPQPEQQ